MQKRVAFLGLVSIGLILGTGGGKANTVSLSGTNNTTGESLTGTTNTFTLAAVGTLTVGSTTLALNLNGNNPSTDTVTNLGTIDQDGTTRAIQDNGGGQTISITNGSSTNSVATIVGARNGRRFFQPGNIQWYGC